MRESGARLTDQPTQVAIVSKPPKGLSPGLVIFFSILATVGGCMSAQGNGTRNAFYFPIWLTLLLFTDWVGKRVEKPKRIQLLCILNGGLLCFLIAYQSSHPAPEKIFKHIFGEPFPASVTQMEGRMQFFDGFNWCLSFEISEVDFQSLAERCKLVSAEDRYQGTEEAERAQGRWDRLNPWVAIAQSDWPRKSPSLTVEAYAGPVRKPSNDVNLLYLVRDPSTRRVWVVNVD
jgi:hypothetical protein